MNADELAQIVHEADAEMRRAAAFYQTPKGRAQLRADYARIELQRAEIIRRIVAGMYAEDDS